MFWNRRVLTIQPRLSAGRHRFGGGYSWRLPVGWEGLHTWEVESQRIMEAGNDNDFSGKKMKKRRAEWILLGGFHWISSFCCSLFLRLRQGSEMCSLLRLRTLPSSRRWLSTSTVCSNQTLWRLGVGLIWRMEWLHDCKNGGYVLHFSTEGLALFSGVNTHA